MGRFHQNRFYLISTLLVLATLVAVACAPNPGAQLISPNMVPEVEGQAFAPPTPTPLPDITSLTDEQIYAGLPEAVADLMPGDPTQGEQVATNVGCVGCHRLDDSNVAVAPTWGGIANTAVTRVAGESPALYLYQSITDPNAFVVDGYSVGMMPQTFKDMLSDQDLADLISYLLSQRGQ